MKAIQSFGVRAGYISVFFLVLTGCASMKLGGMEDIPDTVASADGSPIAYGAQGAGGVTVVFVHCWTCDHSFWSQQIEYFSRNNRVVWLDLAGHGASGSRRERYTMQAFGEDVAAVVRQTGSGKVVLVGHSMGGPVAVEAAKQLGDRVIGIVGVDTFYTSFQYPASQEEIAAFVEPFEMDFHGTSGKMVRTMFTPQADPAIIERIAGKFAGANPDVGISAMYELFAWNAHQGQADLKRFAGMLYNINAAPAGKETPPNDHTVMIKGVGHFIAQVKPEAFNHALEGIIDKLAK